MILCGVLKYFSVFVVDKRRDRLQKLSFGSYIQSSSGSGGLPNISGVNGSSNLTSSFNTALDLVLTDEEAFYLVLNKYLSVRDTENNELSLENLWNVFTKKNSQFVYKFKTFDFFRSQSYVVRPGIHYGSDYTVYKTSPQLCHSELCITIIPAVNNDEVEQNWRHISTLTRVMPDVMKLAVACYVVPSSWKPMSDVNVEVVNDDKSVDTSPQLDERDVIYDNMVDAISSSYVSHVSLEGLHHISTSTNPTVNPIHDEELQLFLQESISLQSESVRVSPETTPIDEEDVMELQDSQEVQIQGSLEEIPSQAAEDDPIAMQRNNSLYGIESATVEEIPVTSAEVLPTVSPYLSSLFHGKENKQPECGSSSSREEVSNKIDLSTYHCLDLLTVRPVTMLVRRLYADATKYQTVGQIHERFCSKSIKKTPKRFLDGGTNGNNSNNKSGKSAKRKRKRRDIAEIRTKTMSKTNQLWKTLVTEESLLIESSGTTAPSQTAKESVPTTMIIATIDDV